MNTESTKFVWVLRDAQSGEPFASQDSEPEGSEFPVQWNFMECYWAKERVQIVP